MIVQHRYYSGGSIVTKLAIIHRSWTSTDHNELSCIIAINPIATVVAISNLTLLWGYEETDYNVTCIIAINTVANAVVANAVVAISNLTLLWGYEETDYNVTFCTCIMIINQNLLFYVHFFHCLFNGLLINQTPAHNTTLLANRNGWKYCTTKLRR